jgi:hypothetical protein
MRQAVKRGGVLALQGREKFGEAVGLREGINAGWMGQG